MLREVSTKYGRIKGLPAADPRITTFKGIPFAAPPVGKNRWRAPQPVEPWDGVLEAYAFAPISVQDRPGIGTDIYCREWHVDPEIAMSEDCLYLNVWTPAKKTDEKLPVLIWYFGGGLQWGYPAEMEFDGERLARRGIIVVSVNYRLNVFGFLAHEEITKEAPQAPGNFGYLDQQAGLRWVYENIAAFGGDPERITIAGQSAGGGSVMSQITCEQNRGLIKGAVVMSGLIHSPYGETPISKGMTLAEAEEWGREFFAFLGVKDLEEARGIEAQTLLQKYSEYVQTHPRMFSIVDGVFCTGDPLTKYLKGEGLDIPIIAGNTADEFLSAIDAADEEELAAKAKAIFGSDVDIFLKYESAHKTLGDRQYGAVSGIELAAKSMFEALKKRGSSNSCYYYRFAPDIPGWDNPGTFHSVDLWFFFETLAKCWRPFVGRHYDLSRKMCNYWANFVKTGDPNGPDADGTLMQEWLPYDSNSLCEMVFTPNGPVLTREQDSAFKRFLKNKLVEQKLRNTPKKQAFNPYLPSWEYVPDGEPYVFGNRVYVYGSHDFYNGDVFCMGDYVCWSADINDLGNWRYEGVIYPLTADPDNPDGDGCLYAPDVTVGPDGRYYLYYVLSNRGYVSVAVCDTPAGRYEFYGNVKDKEGRLLGTRKGDEPQFDPGVLTENGVTYLYTGFCSRGDKSRHGAMGVRLGADMLTMETEPVFVAPGCEYSEGTGFEGHEYFEAASIRKMGDTYVFVYSSVVMHELCYATSKDPLSGFTYGGVLVSNNDLGIDSYKEAGRPMAYGANNHGSIIEINGQWYIFYHRHTNGTWFSRQVCAEKLSVLGEGRFAQAELTSCGLNDGPLCGKGYYPTYIACNLFIMDNACQDAGGASDPAIPNPNRVKIVQDGKDGDEVDGYITNMQDGATAGFKYFDLKGLTKIRIITKGYAGGSFEIRTKWDGEPIATLPIHYSNRWAAYEAEVSIPDQVAALYFTYRGDGNASFKGFELI